MQKARRPGSGSGWKVSVLVALVAAALVAGWLALRAPSSPAALCDALARRRIVTVYTGREARVRCEGVGEEPLPVALVRGLDHPTPGPVIDFLRAHKASAVAIVPAAQDDAHGDVGAQLAAFAHVPELPAVALAPELAVYAPGRPLELGDPERAALAYVARALFRGAREPDVASFPPALRRVERVEVMVTLSKHGDARLWRSARGTSIARALLTATRVARDRWREREQAMGGPLLEQLPSLDVEVALLAEDGTLLSAQSTFVDRAITQVHGVGFDRRTAWHYVLPDEVQRRNGGAHALDNQLSDLGLPTAVLSESDTRLYRFVQQPLGVSRATLAQR